MMGEHPSDARLLLALDGELETREAAAVADHVHACPACRATRDRLATLSGDIERYCRTSYVEQLLASAHAPASQRRVRETARDAAPSHLSWRPRILSRSAALATAAALLLIAGVWLLWPIVSANGGASAPRPSARAMVATRAGDITLAPTAAALAAPASATPATATAPAATVAAVIPPITPPPQPRPRPIRTAAPPAPMGQRPAYYWSLPYSNGALPLSEGSVVMTVRLSRDQLRLAGIPISEPQVFAPRDRDQSLVRAKVLVGADGLPRAISFDRD